MSYLNNCDCQCKTIIVSLLIKNYISYTIIIYKN